MVKDLVFCDLSLSKNKFWDLLFPRGHRTWNFSLTIVLLPWISDTDELTIEYGTNTHSFRGMWQFFCNIGKYLCATLPVYFYWIIHRIVKRYVSKMDIILPIYCQYWWDGWSINDINGYLIMEMKRKTNSCVGYEYKIYLNHSDPF